MGDNLEPVDLGEGEDKKYELSERVKKLDFPVLVMKSTGYWVNLSDPQIFEKNNIAWSRRKSRYGMYQLYCIVNEQLICVMYLF